MTAATADPVKRLPFLAWIAIMLATVVVAGLVGWWLLLRSVEKIPGAVADEGREIVRDLIEVAAAFRQGTVTATFTSHVTSIEGTSRLQVATLDQVESFELRDEATVFWGALDLPPVEVRATAPVTTTYFVDLDGSWTFVLAEQEVLVTAPRLRFNKPAVDVSRIEYEVDEGSLLRDEEEVMTQLRREISGRVAIRAIENEPLVRSAAREEIERFVGVWLLGAFADGGDWDVTVRFANETLEPEPVTVPVVRDDAG